MTIAEEAERLIRDLHQLRRDGTATKPEKTQKVLAEAEDFATKIACFRGGSQRKSGNPSKIDAIAELVQDEMGIPKNLIRGKALLRNYVIGREILIYMARTMENMKTNEIGNYMNRDHSTITVAVRTFTDDYKTCPAFSEQADKIMNKYILMKSNENEENNINQTDD